MDDSIIFMILLQVALIALNAVFACAEIAVISMKDTKLAKMADDGDKRAIRLVKLTSQPARFLATIQVAITLSGFMGSAFAAENFSEVLVNLLVRLGVTIPVDILDSIAVVVITLVLSYFTLVFGELVPKQVAMRNAEPLALGMSGLISAIAKIFAPLVSFLTISTNLMLRLLGIDPNAKDDEVSEEEIRMMVDVGSEKGTIDHQEREFIQNVFEFDDLTAGEVVTHRTEVIMLDLEDTMEEWKEIIFNSRHTHYPVTDGSVDKVVGILKAKDYFRLEDKTRENVIEKAIFPAYFVPETVKTDVLFRNMKRDKQKIAVVLDEYGGMAGIITTNDLVTLLVGDFDDESETEEEQVIELVGEGEWRVHGSALLEEMSEVIGIPLSSEEYDTFNGLIFDALETIPEGATDIEVDVAGLHVRKIEIKNLQVETAIVSVIKKETNETT